MLVCLPQFAEGVTTTVAKTPARSCSHRPIVSQYRKLPIEIIEKCRIWGAWVRIPPLRPTRPIGYRDVAHTNWCPCRGLRLTALAGRDRIQHPGRGEVPRGIEQCGPDPAEFHIGDIHPAPRGHPGQRIRRGTARQDRDCPPTDETAVASASQFRYQARSFELDNGFFSERLEQSPERPASA
jgi:hypothetical protein